MVILFHNIDILLYLSSDKCSLGEYTRFHSKKCEKFKNTKKKIISKRLLEALRAVERCLVKAIPKAIRTRL